MNRDAFFLGAILVIGLATGVALGLVLNDDRPAEPIKNEEIERLETENSELKERSHTKSPDITLTDCYEHTQQMKCEFSVNYPLYRYDVKTNHGAVKQSIVDDSEYTISGTSDGSLLMIQSATGDTYIYTIHIDESGEHLTKGESE